MPAGMHLIMLSVAAETGSHGVSHVNSVELPWTVLALTFLFRSASKPMTPSTLYCKALYHTPCRRCFLEELSTNATPQLLFLCIDILCPVWRRASTLANCSMSRA